MTALRVALLSFAHPHALSYLRALAERDDVELLATDPDRSPAEAGRGPEVAAALGVPYVDGYDEAFAWAPDAVIICAENARHRALAERAAAAGAHILCEKPLATTDDDARAIAAAVKTAGVRLMVAYPVRFAPSFRAIKERIAAGELGDVLAVVGTNNGTIPIGERGWFVDRQLSGGGALVDHIVHCSDLVDALLEEAPESVRAVSNRVLHEDARVAVETGGLVTVRYPSGVIASIDCSWSQPDSAPTWGGLTLEVVGTRGSIRIAPFQPHVGGYDGRGDVWLGLGADLDALMLGEFVSALRDDRQPQPDAEVGVRTTAIMTAAQRSATDGQPVALGG